MMNDQAKGLREMIQQVKFERNTNIGKPENNLDNDGKRVKFITVTSGKGGVGKTNVTLNLAIKLRQLGHRVTVIDADLGLSNVDVVAGVISKFSIYHLLNGTKTAKEILEEAPEGINLISGGSGLMDLVDLSEFELEKLVKSLEEVEELSDYILIDTGAGISASVLKFISLASEIVVIVTPYPASITDAYALIKNIKSKEDNISVIVNRAESVKEADEVFDKLMTACDRFLQRKVKKLGYILEDANVRDSIKSQVPYVIKYPNTSASKSISSIADCIDNSHEHNVEKSSFRSLFGAIIKAKKQE